MTSPSSKAATLTSIKKSGDFDNIRSTLLTDFSSSSAVFEALIAKAHEITALNKPMIISLSSKNKIAVQNNLLKLIEESEEFKQIKPEIRRLLDTTYNDVIQESIKKAEASLNQTSEDLAEKKKEELPLKVQSTSNTKVDLGDILNDFLGSPSKTRASITIVKSENNSVNASSQASTPKIIDFNEPESTKQYDQNEHDENDDGEDMDLDSDNEEQYVELPK